MATAACIAIVVFDTGLVAAQYGVAPTITSFTPSGASPGMTVYLSGSDFTSNDLVLVGGLNTASVYYTSNNESFTVPEVAAGTYMLQVQGPLGNANACCLVVSDAAAVPTSEAAPTTDAAPVVDPSSCQVEDVNRQCNDFGTIAMPSQVDIKGDPVQVKVDIYLNTAYGDHSARWLMFSMRNVSNGAPSPITVGLVSFSSPDGNIVTTRMDTTNPNEVDAWVDVLDAPVGVPITATLNVGATERGAYRLETLVMAFDRGYAPVKDDSGREASLFSFTLLGVNKETGSTANGGGDLLHGNKVPGFEGTAALVLVALTAIGLSLLRGRRLK